MDFFRLGWDLGAVEVYDVVEFSSCEFRNGSR